MTLYFSFIPESKKSDPEEASMMDDMDDTGKVI